MYLSFYHLKHKPFQISTDPRFLWLGEKHEEALATLRYGVLDNKGFLLLTGDVGTGKTTLINALLKNLGENTLVATIRDPDLEPLDFYNYTAHAFGMQEKFSSKGAFLIEFERFLRAAGKKNKTVLLIIDEAQRINQKLLEEVRILSNIELEDRKLLNIFFVGQIEFNEILLRPENRPIRQRITVNYNIPPLTMEETGAYIQYRLKIAGTNKQMFDSDALSEIYTFSKGYPRLINIISDRSLLTGFVEEAKIITAKHVKECAEELAIPILTPRTHSSRRHAPAAYSKSPARAPQASRQAIPASQPRRGGHAFFSRKRTLLAIGLGILLAALYLLIWPPTHIQTLLKIPFLAQTASILHSAPPQNEQDKAEPPGNAAEYPAESAPNNSLINAIANARKPDGSSTENNRPVPGKKGINSSNTAKDQHMPAIQGPAPKSLPYRDALNHPDKSPGSAIPEVAVEKNQPTLRDPPEKMIIPFPADSSFPVINDLLELNNLVDILFLRPEYRVIVRGYTDSAGSGPYNQKLSEFRANSLKSYLVGKGVDESRISVQGMGAQDPIAPNDTASGRSANRRVEIELTK